jgi:hypothetical protein
MISVLRTQPPPAALALPPTVASLSKRARTQHEIDKITIQLACNTSLQVRKGKVSYD